MILSKSFAKLYYVIVIFSPHSTLDAHRFWWHQVLQNCYTMANITPPNGMPKDVNDQLGSVKGLDPDVLNDMVFKLVIILYFFVCHKKSLCLEQHTHPLVSHSRLISHCTTFTSALASLA